MGFTLANQRSLPPRGLKGVAFSGALVGTALEAGVEGGEGRLEVRFPYHDSRAMTRSP